MTNLWLVYGTSINDPDHRAYVLGAHSTRAAALRQRETLAHAYAAHIAEVAVDQAQPPVLIGRIAVTRPDPCVDDRLGDQE